MEAGKDWHSLDGCAQVSAKAPRQGELSAAHARAQGHVCFESPESVKSTIPAVVVGYPA
jgi:hypothetical protein